MKDAKRSKKEKDKAAEIEAQKVQSAGSLYLAMQQEKYKPRLVHPL